jgi:hypothetical protein
MIAGPNFVTPIDSVTGTTASNQYFYNGVRFVIEDMTFRAPPQNQMMMLDLRQVSSEQTLNDVISVGQPAYGGVDPTNQNSVGIGYPQYANNGACINNNMTVDGFYTGKVVGEHNSDYDTAIFNCEYAFAFWDKMGHASALFNPDIFSCRVVLANTNNTTAVLDIFTMNHENNANYWGSTGYGFYSNGFPNVGVVQGRMNYYSDAGIQTNWGMGNNHPDISGAVQAFPTQPIQNNMYSLTVNGFLFLSNSTAIAGNLPNLTQVANNGKLRCSEVLSTQALSGCSKTHLTEGTTTSRRHTKPTPATSIPGVTPTRGSRTSLAISSATALASPTAARRCWQPAEQLTLKYSPIHPPHRRLGGIHPTLRPAAVAPMLPT